MRRYRANGFTIMELLVVAVTGLVLMAAGVPVMRQARLNDGVQGSMSNLAALGVAHLLYAGDWDGRQVTLLRDDLGAYEGDVEAYNAAMDCDGAFDPDCQPPIIAGWGAAPGGGSGVWASWVGNGNNALFQPIIFPGGPRGASTGWGHFRVPNVKPLHDYLGGRYHDAAYFAPNDTVVWEQVGGCLDSPWEFVAVPELESCNPAWSSYSLSPAAMFHPDVFRSDAAGGWQAPWELDHGYESPGFFQEVSFDGLPLSHHVLTTDGILGRDTLGGIQPLAPPQSRAVRRPVIAGAADAADLSPPDFMLFTLMEDGP